MTAKRDLKKRIRARQARTGERYTTARDRVLGARPAPVPVVELVDASAEGARVGWKCRVLVFPDLARGLDPGLAVKRIHEVLVATAGDPGTELFRTIAFEGMWHAPPARTPARALAGVERFVTRAAAGLGGVSDGGALLAVPLVGRQGAETVVCTLWGAPLWAERAGVTLPALPRVPPAIVLVSAQALTSARAELAGFSAAARPRAR
jgi:hypothetical protein